MKPIRGALLALAVLAAGASPAAAQGMVEKARQAKKSCGTCHSFKQADAPRQGPGLWGVVGRTAGSVEGFGYSQGFLDSLAGTVWTRAELDRWIANPKAVAPGTTMLSGQKDPAKRAAILDYLESLN